MRDDQMTMITESTFDPHMRRTMERLEEKLHHGETTVTFDIREALHIFSKMVALEDGRRRAEEMLYRTFKGYSDFYNASPHLQPILMPKDAVIKP